MGNNKIIYSGKLTVRYSMYDFIRGVRERPILWDRKHSEFHMRDKREIAWHEVATKVCNEFAIATTEEKNKMVDTLVKRWKNTRDCFLRSYRAQENKASDNATRRYIYDNELKFLLTRKNEIPNKSRKRKTQSMPTMPTRSRSMRNYNEAKKSRSDANSQSDFDTEFENLCLEVGDIVNLEENTNAESINENSKKQKKEAESCEFLENNDGRIAAETESLTIIKTNTEQSHNETDLTIDTPNPTFSQNDSFVADNKYNTEHDADQCFFDSIKPIMRTLSLDEKLDFQIEVLKLLKHFRNK